MRESYHNPPAAQVKTWSPDARSPERRRYDAELEARVRYHESQGEPESSSWQMAADDLGDVEHWRWINQRRRRRPSRAERPVEVQRLLNRTHALNTRSGVTV